MNRWNSHVDSREVLTVLCIAVKKEINCCLFAVELLSDLKHWFKWSILGIKCNVLGWMENISNKQKPF